MGLLARGERQGLTEAHALDEAWRLLTATNPFPAVLGRVCPHPCEQHCNRGEKDEPVAIAAFERFVGDWGIERNLELTPLAGAVTGSRSIAVVGAGPGGLSCAYHLSRQGHLVTVYESLPQPGGMLRYGVPSYRLSRSVLDAEIARLSRLGVVLRCGVNVGGDLSFEDLRRSHDAVFVAIGAHRGRRLEVSGEDGHGVHSGVEFLRLAHSVAGMSVGERIVIAGDGETAIDAARVANRLGRAKAGPGSKVTLVRALARREQDLDELGQEGIEVVYEAAPVSIERGDGGHVVAVSIQRARLGAPDADGVRLPVRLDGPVSELPADMLIAAVSQVPDWEGLGLLGSPARVEVDDWGRTSREGVWSGGDSIVLGIVAQSIGQGLRAAQSMHAHLCESPLPECVRRQPVSTGRVKLGLYDSKPRSSGHRLTPLESLHNHSAEVEQGITRQQVVYEAGRCLGCGACIGCERCWMFCTPGCFSRSSQPSRAKTQFPLSLDKCDGCDKCAAECPSGFIEMH